MLAGEKKARSRCRHEGLKLLASAAAARSAAVCSSLGLPAEAEAPYALRGARASGRRPRLRDRPRSRQLAPALRAA